MFYLILYFSIIPDVRLVPPPKDIFVLKEVIPFQKGLRHGFIELHKVRKAFSCSRLSRVRLIYIIEECYTHTLIQHAIRWLFGEFEMCS